MMISWSNTLQLTRVAACALVLAACSGGNSPRLDAGECISACGDVAKAERKIRMAQGDGLAAEQKIANGMAQMSRAEAGQTIFPNQPPDLQPQ